MSTRPRGDEEDSLLTKDKDREQIRKELSQMSFEDLEKLKERLGTKVYNETIFGRKKKRKTEFKQKSKDRPCEMSAKVSMPIPIEIVKMKKFVSRDPRFDSLCGTFDEKTFKRSYSFISEFRKNDLQTLKKELKGTTDPKAAKKIKYLIQRFENQLREEKRLEEKKDKRQQEKKELLESIRRGEKPTFKKKSERKILDLVSQYKELKNTGKLKKHIQKLRKKNMHRDGAKLKLSEAE